MAPGLGEIVSLYTQNGPCYDWQPNRDAALLERYGNNKMLPPHHKFDTCEQALVILGQSIKHSAHVEIKAANKLRGLALQAQFVRKADSKPGATTRYMAFIRVPTDFYTQFPFLKARAEVPESSAKHNGLVTGRASIDVCFEPFKAHGPEQEDSRIFWPGVVYRHRDVRSEGPTGIGYLVLQVDRATSHKAASTESKVSPSNTYTVYKAQGQAFETIYLRKHPVPHTAKTIVMGLHQLFSPAVRAELEGLVPDEQPPLFPHSGVYGHKYKIGAWKLPPSPPGGPAQQYPAILGLQVGQSPTADHVRSAMLRAYIMGQDPAKILSCVIGYLSESEVTRLQEAFGAVDKQALQSFNIFSACRHPELRDTILRSTPHDQSSASLPPLPPSYMGMITFVGSRSQKHVTATTLLMLASLGPVFATASSNFVANRFAEGLQHESGKVMEQLNSLQGGSRPKVRSPLVVRGFAVELELLEFMELVKARWRRKTGISPHVAAGAWQKSLSLCEWLFKVTKILNDDLKDTDHAALFTLREAIQKTDFYRPLRTFLVRHHAWPAEQAATRSSTSTPLSSPGNVGLDDDVSKVLKEACVFLVNHCSSLCTTPTKSHKPLYRDFKASAKAIAIVDADNVTRPEAVLVIGDKMRPCVMGGFTPDMYPRPNMAFPPPQNPLYADMNLSLLAAHQENGFFYISC
ncbi:uncharacterized protein F5Z01DRAFT_733928 [Emericellopsis atlantica]|uniref:Uncharacterized protein n=1 Tax=Emericellopsis atlantica TaxID=2614577 RepID=A0A9P8CST2_9HYPO|nr:uncharacterized protein F5Z01DRAFT_733928 [Emericellopsis atlantica]KAG9257520.1 hypothetical protein F5Z01DRAFT_733928 [Emericellopsis atlantica]